MKRTTIDFGIDLGTTNSTVAVVNGAATEVIPNSVGSGLTPSAVWLDRRGQLFAGQRAKERLESEPDDATGEFKLRMGLGTSGAFLFRRSNKVMLPEELSAEVLKELRGAVQQARGEELRAAVITVPAAFDIPQNSATQRAAELAGLTIAPLLQEPVAAALAYGFQSTADKVYWLVYDFGGGTFDAAIVQPRDGIIHVVNHAGDNELGGKHIDWAVIEKLFVPALVGQYALPGFRRGAERWRSAFAKLKEKAEDAKIRVSRTQKPFAVYIESLCVDAAGKSVDFEFTLMPKDLARLAEPFVRRSLELSKQALAQKNVPANAIERVLFVGGTSLLPLVREAIKSELVSTIEMSINPLEVVARGAAIFAGTQRLNLSPGSSNGSDVIELQLEYDPIGSALNFPVGGKFRHPKGRPLTGYSVQITETKSRWQSGRIPLAANGAFITEGHAERGRACEFAVELYDQAGTRQRIDPVAFTYTVGMTVAGAMVMHNVGVAMANNRVDWVLKKGQTLPTRRRLIHTCAQGLKRGAAGQALRVPIVEGECEHRGDRNPLIGFLEILSNNPKLRRDIPVGADVEITIEMDASRIIRVRAEVPLVDLEMEVTLNDQGYQPRSADKLKADLENEVARMKTLTGQAHGTYASGIFSAEDMALVERIDELVAASQGDVSAGKEAEKRLLDLKGKLDLGEESVSWPAAEREAQECLEETRKLVGESGGAAERKLLPELEVSMKHALGSRSLPLLQDAIESLRTLGYRVLEQRIDFWLEFQEYLEDVRDTMHDPVMADRLFAQAVKCAASKDLTGLRAALRQLHALLPEDKQAEAASHGYGGGTIRRE